MASRIDPQELLSDPRHVINLSLSLYQLQQQGCMCDCSIRARQGSLDVHRLVLMASDSPYFQENLHIIPSTDGQFSGQPETSCISLRDQDLLVVQAVIQFVYMGEMCVSTSNVDRVLALCKLLGLARAEKLCETFIRKNSDRQSGMMSDIERSDNVVSFVNFPVVSTPVVSINRADEDKVTSSNVDGQNIPIPVSQIQPTITSPDSGGISAFVSSASSSLLGTMYIYRSGDNNTAADARSGADAIEKIDIKINPSMSDEDIDDDLGDGGYDMHDVEDSKFTTALLDSISTVAASSTALQLQENTDTTNTRKRRSRKPGKRAANSVKKTTTGKGQKRTAAPKSKPIASTSQIKTRRTASASHDNTETTDIGQSSNVKGEQTAGQSSTLHDPVCDDSDADVDDHKSDLDETQATDASENSKQKGSNVSNYCRSCKIRFSDKEKFQEHKKEVHQFTCEVCGWSSDRGINLASHMFNQHGVQYEPDKYPLRQCDQPMSSVQTTDVGFRKLAVSNKMYICEFCGTVLKSRSGFRRHLLHHNGGEPHKCTICGKSFIDKEHFLGHINGHRGVEPYICTICKKTFTYRRSLLRHRAYCKGNAVILHRCKTCCKTFGKKETLRDHIKGQHSDFGKVYACSVCGKRFKWRGSRSKHINTKHGHFF